MGFQSVTSISSTPSLRTAPCHLNCPAASSFHPSPIIYAAFPFSNPLPSANPATISSFLAPVSPGLIHLFTICYLLGKRFAMVLSNYRRCSGHPQGWIELNVWFNWIELNWIELFIDLIELYWHFWLNVFISAFLGPGPSFFIPTWPVPNKTPGAGCGYPAYFVLELAKRF